MRPIVFLALLASACATTGTRPNDMTATGHESASEAEAQRGSAERAAEHRAAADRLRETEALACAGLPAADRDNSPLLAEGAVTSVVPLLPRAFSNKNFPDRRLVGATVTLRAERGATAEWLQRVVSCHIARNALGEGAPAAMQDCPLAVAGISASVRSTGAGFAVEISAQESGSGAAEEVLRRASRLAPAR